MRKLIQTVLLLILATTFNVYAEAPNLLTYQGRLKEGGQAVSGNRLVKILLCDSESGVTCHNTGEQSVTVSNGLFRSTFTVPVTALVGTGDWYLEIVVGGATLTPRERLTSSAYSLFAATAAFASNITAAAGSDGVHISSSLYVTGKYYGDGSELSSLPVSGGAVAKTGDTMTGQLTLAGSTLTVTGNAFSVGGSTLTVYGGKMGIGTQSPSGMLEIYAAGSGQTHLVLNNPSSDVGLFIKKTAMRGILAMPYYNDRVVLSNRSAPFPGVMDPYVTLWDVGNIDIGVPATGYIRLGGGNVGISSAAPSYRLVVSSGAGEGGNMLVISTGSSNVIRMTGAGEIYANKYYGDGTALTGITATTFSGTLPVINGGTGKSTVASDKILYTSALDTFAESAVSAAGLAILDDVNAGAQRTTLGLGSVDNTADSAKPVSSAQQTALDLKAPIASPTFTGTVAGITKAMVGLGSVDNTADADKPVSSAQSTALAAKADSSSVLANNATVSPLLIDLSTVTTAVGLKLAKAGDTMTGQLTLAGSTLTVTGHYGGYGLQVSSNVSLAGVLYSANGNVGIGTAAPFYKLDISGGFRTNTGLFTTAGDAIALNTVGGNIRFGAASGVNEIYTAGSDLALMPGGTAKVGIGTTSPGSKLEVAGGSLTVRSLDSLPGIASFQAQDGNYRLIVATDSVKFKPYFPVYLSDNSGWGGGMRYNQAGSEALIIAARNPLTKLYFASGFNFAQSPGQSITPPASAALIISGAYVGIGTESPADKLQVSGGITASSATFNTVADVGLRVSSSAYLATSGGNVGIGTVSPAAKLSVNGNAVVSGTMTAGGLILPASGITSVSADAVLSVDRVYMRVVGNGGSVTLDAATGIAAGIPGQMVIIEGTDDVNTVTILDSGNVNLQTAYLGSCVLGIDDTLTLIYNGSRWIEVTRAIN